MLSNSLFSFACLHAPAPLLRKSQRVLSLLTFCQHNINAPIYSRKCKNQEYGSQSQWLFSNEWNETPFFFVVWSCFLPLSRSCHSSSEEGGEEEEVKGANEIRTKRLSGKSSYFAALFCFPASSSFLLLGREAYFAGTLDTWTWMSILDHQEK